MNFQNHATSQGTESAQANAAPISLSDIQSPQVERKLLPVGSDEIPISGSGLTPHFVGDANDFSKQMRKLLGADPKKTALHQMECTIGAETFTFHRRETGNVAVWALSRGDRSRLSKAMGWEERIELGQLQDNEIAISRRGLSAHFIGDASNLGKKLQDCLIADPQKTALRQVECTINEETFTFFRRQSGKHLVWALPVGDRSRFAKVMGWTEKNDAGPLQENEFAISKQGLSPYFFGGADRIRKQLLELLGSDPEKAVHNQTECSIGVELFIFTRRRAGAHVVWALPCVETSRLARAMGWMERVELGQLQANEIAVSAPGLVPHFIGCAKELKRELQGLLHADPQRTASHQIECVIGKEMFTFLKRQNGSSILWTLPLADKSRLGKAMGWGEKIELDQLQENEIAVSGPGLSPHFIGIAAKLKKQFQGHILVDPENTTWEQVECTIGGEIFTLCRRQSGPRIVWALPLADRTRLAKAMNWEIKKEKEPSTGVAALATFLSAVETHNAAPSKQPGSSTQ